MQPNRSKILPIILFFICTTAWVVNLPAQVPSINDALYASLQTQNQNQNLLIYKAPKNVNEKNKKALNKIISVDFKNVLLLEALRHITERADIRLAFSKDVTLEKWDTKINLKFEEATVLGALYAVLRAAEQEQIALQINKYGLLIVTEAEIKDEDIEAAVGVFSGTVIDESTGDPLVGANVILENTSIGTATDFNGEFRVNNVPEGLQTFQIRYLGFETKVVEVEIIPDEVVEREIALFPGGTVEGEDITIISQAEGQARAIGQQVNSNTIVNVVSEDRLREMADANAAETIGRLPGISVLRDAGEGQKVSIRGMGPRYSSITINGNQVPGTSGDRSVDLSMISQDMLSGIEIYKSNRPDMDADAIGGSVNFLMGGAPRGQRLRGSFTTGYSSQINGTGNFKGSVLGSNRFLDDKLGVMISANAQKVDRSAHVFNAGYRVLRDALEGEPHAPVEVNNLTLEDIESTRKRYGAGVTLDWKMPNGKILTNNSFNLQDREDLKQTRQYNWDTNRQDWDPRHTKRKIYTLNNSISGQHDFSWVEIEWRGSRSATANNTPYNHVASFWEPSALIREGVDLSGGADVLADIAKNRTELAVLQDLRNSEREQYQRNYAASMDIEVPVALGRYIEGYVKIGGKHYNKYRDRLSTNYRLPNWELQELYNDPESEFPWEVNSSGRPVMGPFLTDQRYTILNGQYVMDHLPSIELTDQLWDNNSDVYTIDFLPRLDDYNATERLSAGYIMTELNIGSKFMILPGVRYEYEHSDYSGFIGRFTVNPENIEEDVFYSNLQDTADSRKMGMWFPMVQARFMPVSWFDIRLARTVTTSRPSFGDLKPTLEIDYDGGTVDRGYTQIRPMRSTNYDLFLTFNHNKFGLFTVGGFYKEVEDLIYNRRANIIFPSELGLDDNVRLFDISEPVNNENLTTVRGFEVEWQSNLTGLPSPFNGLVINANYSRFLSEAFYHGFEIRRGSTGFVGVDTFRTAPMVHQADHIANASIGYDYGGFSSRFSMQYQGPTLRSVGNRPETDRYTDDYLRFDASIRQRFFDRSLHLVINLHNITNREDRSSQFTRDRPRSIEYYGTSFDIGIEYRF